MNKLSHLDLVFAVRRLPKVLRDLMETSEWAGQIFAAGGYIRSIVAGDEINDVDVFSVDKPHASVLAALLVEKIGGSARIHETENAYTIIGIEPTIQIIHRWSFKTACDLVCSFDFTCCRAAIYYRDSEWKSQCDENFYPDVAAKRLVYCAPVREEAPGGSMLRVLKYYQKGYRMPLDSLAKVISRLVGSEVIPVSVIQQRLFEVDPQVDPTHIAHLPPEHSII